MAIKRLSKSKKASVPKKYHVKKGDTVMIVAGKDKGKTGTVKRILRTQGRLLVEGLNLVKKAVRPNPMAGQRGGIIEMEAPLEVSNVMVYDLKANKATRVRRETVKTDKGEKRVRVAVKTNAQLDD